MRWSRQNKYNSYQPWTCLSSSKTILSDICHFRSDRTDIDPKIRASHSYYHISECVDEDYVNALKDFQIKLKITVHQQNDSDTVMCFGKESTCVINADNLCYLLNTGFRYPDEVESISGGQKILGYNAGLSYVISHMKSYVNMLMNLLIDQLPISMQ